jgi:osmotically inducible lipoprotein OsmB
MSAHSKGEQGMRRMAMVAAAAVMATGLAACDVDRDTGRRTLVGAGGGAAVGAVVGGLGSGTILGGAAVGAAAGAAGGFVADQIERSTR